MTTDSARYYLSHFIPNKFILPLTIFSRADLIVSKALLPSTLDSMSHTEFPYYFASNEAVYQETSFTRLDDLEKPIG
jgi:hypothetical protein